MAELWSLLWHWRVRLVALWLVVMLLVLIRLLVMANVYTSSCLLSPIPLEQVEDVTGGALVTSPVRGLLTGGTSRDDYAVVSFLASRQLAAAVVEELDLAKELFPDRWDSNAGRWIESAGGEPSAGLSREALSRHTQVDYRPETGMVVLKVHWGSPVRAREVADGIIEVADRLLRDTAIQEGERRVAELHREMDTIAVAEVGAYLAEEMTRAISSLASIRARARYAFRVIDPPAVPLRKSWPPRGLLLILAGLCVAGVEFGVVAGMYLRARMPGERRD